MAHILINEVVITVTEVKWGKMRSVVIDLDMLIREDKVPHKRLECIRGFLIYVTSTYKWMILYLKGLHLKIDGWQEGHEKDLYKTKSHLQVRLKVCEWEHENWLEEK